MRKISSIGSLPVHALQTGILDDRLSDSTIWLTSKERLLRWVSSLNLTRIMFKDEQKAFLRFPEYLTPVSFLAHKDESGTGIRRPGRYSKLPFKFPLKFTCRVVVPHPTSGLSERSIEVHPWELVENILDNVCAAFTHIVRDEVVAGTQTCNLREGSGSNVKYVLKVFGCKSYLVHTNYPILWYDYIQQQLRESNGESCNVAKIILKLVRITPEENMLLRLIRCRPCVRCTSEGTEEESESFFRSLLPHIR